MADLDLIRSEMNRTTSTSSYFAQTSSGAPLAFHAQGWTSPPNSRGTSDILYSAVATILLCSWTAVCINIPKPQWSKSRVVLQKILGVLMSLIASEAIFQISLCQWRSARRSVAQFRDSGYKGWTKRHAFLADMGGFRLHPLDYQGFAITARQLHFLVVNRYIDYEDVRLSIEDIEDKNKSDGFARLVAMSQIIWFTASTIARPIQGLQMSTLELVTLTWIPTSLATYALWWYKPRDVRMPITIYLKRPLGDILKTEGRTLETPIRQTPLEFVPQDFFSHQVYWYYGVHVLRRLGMPFAKRNEIPWQKIPDDHCPAPCEDSYYGFVLFLIQGCCMITHAAAWKFYFASEIERLCWHIATILVLVGWLGIWAVDKFVWRMLPELQGLFPDLTHFTRRLLYSGSSNASKKHWIVDYLLAPLRWGVAFIKERSPEFAEEEEVPLKVVLPVALFCFMYLIGRLYVIVEAFVGLRSLPSSVYTTVAWSNIVPHI